MKKSNVFVFVLLALFLVSCGGGGGGDDSDGETYRAFITTWDTDTNALYVTPADQLKLPLASDGTYDFTVDWGDGSSDTITSYDQAEITHTYAVAGIYDVEMLGRIEGFGFSNSGAMDHAKLIDVTQWGTVKLHNHGYQFFRTLNFTNLSASDVPDLSGVTNMSGMFASSVFNQYIGDWDVSHVTDMTGLFGDNHSFNQDIGGWDVSNVTNMWGVFLNAPAFNQDISAWDVSQVTTMFNMFFNATAFNQDIGGWDVGTVSNMGSMFSGASAFNQDLESWDVSNVTNMTDMFLNSGMEGSEPSWY